MSKHRFFINKKLGEYRALFRDSNIQAAIAEGFEEVSFIDFKAFQMSKYCDKSKKGKV